MKPKRRAINHHLLGEPLLGHIDLTIQIICDWVMTNRRIRFNYRGAAQHREHFTFPRGR
jgi:hypothetical protein